MSEDSRQLPADVIEAELVIRDRPTAWSLVLVVLVGLIEASHNHSVLIVSLLAVVIVATVAELFLYPPSIVVGATGLAVRQYGRTRRYAWGAVEAIEIGNPRIPTNACVVLKAGPEKRVIELPRFSRMTPAELVELLESRRKLSPDSTNKQ